MRILFAVVFRLFPRRRFGKTFCDAHWQVIQFSRKDEKPIDPDVAALGIAIALHLKDVKPLPHACCEIPPSILEGIFERSRGWTKM